MSVSSPCCYEDCAGEGWERVSTRVRVVKCANVPVGATIATVSAKAGRHVDGVVVQGDCGKDESGLCACASGGSCALRTKRPCVSGGRGEGCDSVGAHARWVRQQVYVLGEGGNEAHRLRLEGGPC